ncbi:hypothetical protein SHIRM173S_01139 [Streptomyces hirsutus]
MRGTELRLVVNGRAEIGDPRAPCFRHDKPEEDEPAQVHRRHLVIQTPRAHLFLTDPRGDVTVLPDREGREHQLRQQAGL